jgi:hydrogenase maturation protease
MQTQTANTLVLGVGNILLKDEGIGVHLVREMLKLALPANVEIIDGGTAALDVLIARPGLDKLIVIDAVRAGEEPGTIYKARFKSAEFFGNQEQPKISLHQVDLLEALAIAEKLNCSPQEIVIIGVEPAELNCGLELTEQVKQKIPEIVNAVFEEIEDVIHEK